MFSCIAKHLKNDFNAGVIDYRKGENIIESYDFEWGNFGKMAPLLLMIKDGKMYQLPQKSYNILYFAGAVLNIEKAAVYTAPVYETRNELNILVEYVWKELAAKNPFKLFDKWFKKTYKFKKNDHYYVDKYFTNVLFKS